MKLTGVRFLLFYGHFVNVSLRSEDASFLMHCFIKGGNKHETFDYLMFPNSPQEMPWAVNFKDIVGVHLFDIEQALQQAQQQGNVRMTPSPIPRSNFPQRVNGSGWPN